MKPLLLCAFAALLAVPAQSQIHVGGDVGGSVLGGDFEGAGPAASFYAVAEWGVLRGRLGLLDATVLPYASPVIGLNDDGTIALDDEGFAVVVGEQTGSVSRIGSTLTVGVAVPLYRGAGVAFDAGVRVYHATLRGGDAQANDVPFFPILAPEIFAPGPRGTRLHLRSEIYPSSSTRIGVGRGVQLLRLSGGVSVPLRF